MADKAPVVLTITPTESAFGKEDPRWFDELFELQQILKRQVPESIMDDQESKDKGGPELVEIILAIGSSGLLTVAIDAFKAWLQSRPEVRELRVDYDMGGRKGTLTINATNIGSTDLTSVANAVFSQDD